VTPPAKSEENGEACLLQDPEYFKEVVENIQWVLKDPHKDYNHRCSLLTKYSGSIFPDFSKLM